MRIDADAICEVLGLGESCGPAEPVAGGSSADRWRVRTGSGHWMVKTMPAPAAWQLREMVVSGRLERAAYQAGVPMPMPAESAGPAVGYWARVGQDGGYARASAWVDGRPPAGPADVPLARWLGRTLASIERLALPGDPAAEAAYPVHPVPAWRGWLDEAAAAGVVSRRQAPGVLAAVTDATALMREGLAGGPAFRLAHRDASRANIVITASGPVLIDFGYAGPEVPWWECVHHGFDLASPVLGEQPPQAELVQAVLAAHAEAGGITGPARPDAFAGLIRAVLGSLAYHVWLAVGHRPASGPRRAASAASAQLQAARLPEIMDSLGAWCRLIR